jgi:multidrug efflux pump subunit AcrB
VAESIHHYKQMGRDKYQSAVKGFKRVIMPVIVTILTTVLAFSSMFVVGDNFESIAHIFRLIRRIKDLYLWVFFHLQWC